VHKKSKKTIIYINNIEDYMVELKFMVWTNTSKSSAVKNQLYDLISQRFEKEGIEISQGQTIVQQG